MLQLPGLWPPRARVSLQEQGQRIREHLRADPQQREGQGEIQGADVWNLLDMREARHAANCQKGKGKGVIQVLEPEVFDQWEPEE